MKYKLKIDIGLHCKGDIIEQTGFGDYSYYQMENRHGHVPQFSFYESDISLLIQQGVIEEIEEKEFTRSEVISILEYRRNLYYSGNEAIDNWLKQRGKQ
jgi:hypothetical protein